MERRILPLDGPLPRYIRVIGSDGWGGTWCSSCIFTVLEQEVFGFVMPVPLRNLKALGLRIDPTRLWRHNRPVMIVEESPEQTCKICDHGKPHHRARASK